MIDIKIFITVVAAILTSKLIVFVWNKIDDVYRWMKEKVSMYNQRRAVKKILKKRADKLA